MSACAARRSRDNSKSKQTHNTTHNTHYNSSNADAHQSASKSTRRLAPMMLRPTPPALEESRKTKLGCAGSLNVSTSAFFVLLFFLGWVGALLTKSCRARRRRRRHARARAPFNTTTNLAALDAAAAVEAQRRPAVRRAHRAERVQRLGVVGHQHDLVGRLRRAHRREQRLENDDLAFWVVLVVFWSFVCVWCLGWLGWVFG